MKRILLILVNFVLCIHINAQTESCLEIVNELTKQKEVWTEQEAINYVLSHKDSFDMYNESDKWLYNLALGTNYYPLQQFREALVCLREVTTICDKYGSQMFFSSNPQILIAYYWEANSEFYTGAPKEIVLSKLQRAKSVFEQYAPSETIVYNQILSDIDDIEAIGIRGFDFLGNIPQAMEYFTCNKHNEAIPLLEQIIKNWPQPLLRRKLLSYYHILGLSYTSVGRLNDAEQLYLNALSMLERDGNEQSELYRNICSTLGFIYRNVHNYQKAKDYYGRSKWLHEKYMDFDNSYVSCLSNCAVAEHSLGNISVAKLLIDVALKYKGALQNSRIQLLSNAAMIYLDAGFGDDAVICAKECISLCEELGVPNFVAYHNMGTMYLCQSRVNESLPYFLRAISLCETDYEKNEALFSYASALWLSHSDKCSELAMQASKALANSIANNFSFLSQEERFNYYKHFEFYLPWLNVMLYESGNESQYGCIYDNILTTKGLLLGAANKVKHTIMESGNEELIGNYNRMITLRQQLLTEQDSTLQIAIAKEIELLDKQLTRSADAYGAFSKSNGIRWQDIRAGLNDDDIAIEFYNIPIICHSDTVQKIGGEPRFCAVILKKEYPNPKIVTLCKESELTSLDVDFLYSPDVLYQLIWKPIESELEGVHNVYFAADRALHNIGIEYARLQDKSYIDEHYNIYRLSSTRVLKERHKRVESPNAILYGGLRYDLTSEQLIAESRSGEYRSKTTSRAADMSDFRYGVKYLPGTKEEVDNIYESFSAIKNAKCNIITDIAGTEESFKSLPSKNVGIIHLATHGFYWSEEEAEERSYVNFLSNMNNESQHYEDRAFLRSGLFFSGANIGLKGENLPDDVEDGVLTAQELSNINLGHVDMVVMSACESGLGETSGEGVFGLQRGFKLAGANTLLMSLWKVDDTATQLLMTDFYRNYLSGKSKQESLRLAQQSLRNSPDYSDPEYWAGFILLDGID